MFENYGIFPDIDVKLLDKWGQPSVVPGKNSKLALCSSAFSQGNIFSSISHGKARFPCTPIKVENLTEPQKQTVSVNLVAMETGKKKKTGIKEVMKNLHEFEITVTPSSVCQKIKVVKVSGEEYEGDVLELDAAAGSTVSGLKVIGFTEAGKQLTDQEFLSLEPYITTTWAEVRINSLCQCFV